MSIFTTFVNNNNVLFKDNFSNPLTAFRALANKEVKYINVYGVDKTGIAGFKFHIPQQEHIVMQNEVTDMYIEDNSPVQDHIVSKPIEITLQGFVGDYFYSTHKVESIVSEVVTDLNVVNQFLPQLTNMTMHLKNEYFTKNQLEKTGSEGYGIERIDGETLALTTAISSNKKKINWNGLYTDIANLWGLFSDLYKVKSEQVRAFMFLEALWSTRQVFTIETSWRKYDNMVITSLRPIRDNNADITDFTITFKQLNFISTLTQDVEEGSADRLNAQKAKEDDLGNTQGEDVALEQ